MARKLTTAHGSNRSRREEGGRGRERSLEHVPVMESEVLGALSLRPHDVVLDATFGAGGHSRAIRAASGVALITMDADRSAGADITGNFADLKEHLKQAGVAHLDKALFDFGWRSQQLESGRGFSFLVDEPLNMSYGESPRSGLVAAQMLNELSEQALADILYGYGEERYARRIAGAIVRRRKITPFKTTFELVEVLRDAVPAAYRHGRLNPATKTFQALRIAVNDELGAIKEGLAQAWAMLRDQGRIVVITFHSTEDRLVKKIFQSLAKEGGELVYKKAVAPSRAEIARNPRSRSAKLRAIQKI